MAGKLTLKFRKRVYSAKHAKHSLKTEQHFQRRLIIILLLLSLLLYSGTTFCGHEGKAPGAGG